MQIGVMTVINAFNLVLTYIALNSTITVRTNKMIDIIVPTSVTALKATSLGIG